MKHVGKMANNGAKIVVVYRTLPGDAYSALVVGTNSLQESYHDSLMSLVQSDNGQSANELAEILAVRKFPDGSNMLGWLHSNGLLKKVPTDSVLMTPTTNYSVPLDELNSIIAQQKGVAVDDLALTDGINPNVKSKKSETVKQEIKETVLEEQDLTPTQMRSKADALFKQAQQLRRKADELDPPKSKSKKPTVSIE